MQGILERTGGASQRKTRRLLRHVGLLLRQTARTLAANKRFARSQCGLAVAIASPTPHASSTGWWQPAGER